MKNGSILATIQHQMEVMDGGNGRSATGTVSVILNTVFIVAGIVAVIVIIFGGVSYLTSQGDSAKINKGKTTIIYGIIGLAVTLLATVIVNYVLNHL